LAVTAMRGFLPEISLPQFYDFASTNAPSVAMLTDELKPLVDEHSSSVINQIGVNGSVLGDTWRWLLRAIFGVIIFPNTKSQHFPARSVTGVI
jgi:hypothetical protein